MNPLITLYCPRCRQRICCSGDFFESQAIFDGRFYLRFCRPNLTSVYGSLEGARCSNCTSIVGGVYSFLGCYGYNFFSGPLANFAEMHEFYGPVHLFPGDEETSRSFINARGWDFPHLLEQYLVHEFNQASGVNLGNNNGFLRSFADSFMNFFIVNHFPLF